MQTIKVTLMQRYGNTTPNAKHYASAYEALGDDLAWFPTHAVLEPARSGQPYEEIPYGEFLNWAMSE